MTITIPQILKTTCVDKNEMKQLYDDEHSLKHHQLLNTSVCICNLMSNYVLWCYIRSCAL